MKKTIILSDHLLNTKLSKGLLIALAIFTAIRGIEQLVDATRSTGQLALAIFSMMCGVYALGTAFILFGNTRLTPKVEIDDTQICIRESISKPIKRIHWDNIKEIRFGSFELDFNYHNNTGQLITLRTDAQTSISVKKSIREFAEARSIPISL